MTILHELFDSLTDQERKLIAGILPPKENIDELLKLPIKEFTLKLRNSLSLEQLGLLSDAELEYRGELMDRIITAWRLSPESDEGVPYRTQSIERQQQAEEDEEEDTRTPSEKLLDLANGANILLFKDQYRIPHVLITVGEHLEILRVESGAFRRYLTKLYYDSEKSIIGSEAVKNVVNILQARAEYEGATYPLSLRVAWHNDYNIYYDMTNDIWSCVKITPQEWQLVDKTPIPTFMRYTQVPQADPIRDYPADIFDKFLGLTNLRRENEDDRLLLMVYIVSLFIPDIPHVMLVLHGEKGSAKSTLQTLIKMLVDPAKPRLLTVYKDEKEFIQQLAHNHVAFYDNLKHTPRWYQTKRVKQLQE